MPVSVGACGSFTSHEHAMRELTLQSLFAWRAQLFLDLFWVVCAALSDICAMKSISSSTPESGDAHSRGQLLAIFPSVAWGRE